MPQDADELVHVPAVGGDHRGAFDPGSEVLARLAVEPLLDEPLDVETTLRVARVALLAERQIDALALLGAVTGEVGGIDDPSEPEGMPYQGHPHAGSVDRRAVPVLLKTVGNLENATDTRHAAAEALGRIADPASREALENLAADYPETSTRRALVQAYLKCAHPPRTAAVTNGHSRTGQLPPLW